MTLPQAVGHHTLYFSLRTGVRNHHFSSDTASHGFVTSYSAPKWTKPLNELEHDEDMEFLLTGYGLAERGQPGVT